MDLVPALINSLGVKATVGIAGLYLIFTAIIGRLIPEKIMGEVLIKATYKKALLAIFGFVLAAPTIYGLYVGADFVPTPIKEEVAEAPAGNGNSYHEGIMNDSIAGDYSFRGFTNAVLRNGADGYRFMNASNGEDDAECRRVEYFGLKQEYIRRLKYASFRDEVYVYVGDIHFLKVGPSYVCVVVAERGWLDPGKIKEADFKQRLEADNEVKEKFELNVTSRGDSIRFQHSDRRYKLTVEHIYAVLIGSDEIAVEICKYDEEPAPDPEPVPVDPADPADPSISG